jgi:cell wall-associated NlpC family hydrolase
VRTRRLIALLATAATAAAAATAATAKPPSPAIQAQQARERAVLAQIASIGANLEQVVQAYDGARLRLATVERNLRWNTLALGVARRNLHASQQRLAERIVSLYVNGQPGALDILAGAKSLSDVIDRLESEQVLSKQDAALGATTLRFQGTVTTREALLRRQRRERAATVARLHARRQTIEAALAEQQRLLASIHRTIAQIQAQEAARARRLAELARERIARALAASQQAQALATGQTAAAASGLVESPAAPSPVSAPGHPEAATIATQYLGVPYVWGGASPSGFDCSGLVMYVYAQLGISLPHYTVSQWDATIPIAPSQLEPGDLVFFDGLSHVGIYIGGGEFIHAPYTGTVVQVASLAAAGSAFVGARRVP